MEKQDQQYLVSLISRAKDKIKTEYDLEIDISNIKIDSNKTLEINKSLIIQSIKVLRDDMLAKQPTAVKVSKSQKIQKSATKKVDEEEKAKKAAEELAKKKDAEKLAINEWKQQFKQDMVIKSPAYFEMEKYIEMVCDDLSNFTVIQGKGGLAKSWSSQAILKKREVKYAYYNSFTTPVEFYNFLYDHQQNEVLLIDDCEGLWDNKALVSLLKNATELNRERIISWNSTTSKLGDRSTTTKFTSRIILLTNKIPNIEKNPHLQALMSRAFISNLHFSYQEVLDVIKEVSKRDYNGLNAEQRQEIYTFIERNTSEATKDLSIRTLIKLYKFYQFDKTIWKKLASKMVKADFHREVVWDLGKTGKTVKEQETIYQSKTGRSRADFYRIRKELKV